MTNDGTGPESGTIAPVRPSPKLSYQLSPSRRTIKDMSHDRLLRPSRRHLLFGFGAFTLVGCAPASGRPDLVDGPVATTTTATPPTSAAAVTQEPTPESSVSVPSGRDRAAFDRSIVATAVPAVIEVFAEPDGEIIHMMDNPTPTNGPLVFLTSVSRAGWHEVLLPVRPNGSLGWVRDADVSLTAHNYRIKVDLARFGLQVFERGVTIFDTVAGVARGNAPTPGGRYYLTELLRPLEPDTVYGSFAYGLSGFSDTFQTFNGGPGQLGIHGTNDPETLGTAVSAGCIRIHNDDVTRLVEFLPLGVPVEVA